MTYLQKHYLPESHSWRATDRQNCGVIPQDVVEGMISKIFLKNYLKFDSLHASTS